MKNLLLLMLTTLSINIACAQDQPKSFSANDLKKMADAKMFKFTAKDATLPVDRSGTTPATGSDRTEDNHKTLSAGYYTSITPDSVVSYLPYYDKTETHGTDENASTTVVEDPSKSVATTYDYQVKQKKNGTVTINIKPKGGKVTKYVIQLQPNGTANIDATIDDFKVIKYGGTFTN